eukprot:15649-Pelagococcus_subviridis.AAC.2
MSVCSLKLTRTSSCPDAFASAAMSDVLPTPGEPSSKIGFVSCIARRTRAALRRVDGAVSSNDASLEAEAARPRGIVNGEMPKTPLASMKTPSPDEAPASPPGLAAASIAACAGVEGRTPGEGSVRIRFERKKKSRVDDRVASRALQRRASSPREEGTEDAGKEGRKEGRREGSALTSAGSVSSRKSRHARASPRAVSSGNPNPRPNPSSSVRYAPCANASEGVSLRAVDAPVAAARMKDAHATKSRTPSAAFAAPRPATPR